MPCASIVPCIGVSVAAIIAFLLVFYYYSHMAQDIQDLNGLKVSYEWKYLNWASPSVNLTGEDFILGNSLTMDVDLDEKRRIFITSPHLLQGSPITLSIIKKSKGPGGPLLAPYPNWKWHRPGCDGMVSVYRVAVDNCNRLWVVDDGSIGRKPVCPKKILLFDLNTDELLHKYIIPKDQLLNNSELVTPIVDDGETCDDAYLFIADAIGQGLLVYNLKDDTSWRWNNTAGNAFGIDEEATNLTIATESFRIDAGILGMSLSPPGFFDKRYLYFNSMASFYEKFTDVDSLKNSSSEPTIYRSVERRLSQAGAQATSRTGAIFFQIANSTALACWNIENPFTSKNIVIVAKSELALQYISGIKIKENNNGEEEIWLNTNRLQKTIDHSRLPCEINFRVLRGKVNDLIRNTNCAPTGWHNTHPNFDSWQEI